MSQFLLPSQFFVKLEPEVVRWILNVEVLFACKELYFVNGALLS